MTLRDIMSKSCAVCFVLLFSCAIAVGADTSPSPSTAPSGTSPAILTQSVSELSAQRAAAERSQMYRAGANYGRWLDGLAKKSDGAFLQTPVYDRITWMRLLACIVTLGVLGLITSWFLWIVRRRAGEIHFAARPIVAETLRLDDSKAVGSFCPGFWRRHRSHAHRYRSGLAADSALLGGHHYSDCLRRRDHRAALARFSSGSRG